jgi:drug/metabolite transporter (DMT)-like permease
MNKKLLALSALTTSAVIWGLTVPLLKVNLEVIPPLSLAFIRFTTAAIVALYFIKISEVKLSDFLNIGKFAFVGITLHISLLFFGLRETSTINASLIYTLAPVITSLLAVFAIREKINFSHLFGILLAFSGVFLYITYPLVFDGTNIEVNLWGDLLVFISTVSGSIYVIGSKKLFETYKPSTISALSFATGALSFLPLAALEFFSNSTWTMQLSWFNLVSLAFLSLFSSFLAYSVYEWGLSKLAVHIEATISYLTPIISIIAATIFLKEKLQPIFLVTIILVVIGIYLVGRFKPSMHPHYHHHHHKS